jgi:hypothetical protein
MLKSGLFCAEIENLKPKRQMMTDMIMLATFITP